jgi:hypothetical protein
MTDSPRAESQHAQDAEQLKARAERRKRDRALTMSARLERVHHLCAQLAQLEPVRRQPQR